MLETDSSLVISRQISYNNRGSGYIPFNLPSDQNGKFEIFWNVSGLYIGNIGIKWNGAKIGSIKGKKLTFFLVSTQHELQNAIPLASWSFLEFPETSQGSIISTQSLRDWHPCQNVRLFIEFSEISALNLIVDPIPSKHIEIHSNQSPISNDVRIYFSRTQSDLWTTELSLKKASDHFETLLSPDFSEGEILNVIRNNLSNYEKDFDDSDDDETEFDRFIRLTKLESSGEEIEEIVSEAPFKQIKIDAIAHSTYRAFLHWIQTFQISFAPLSSNYRLKINPKVSRRIAVNRLIENSALPRPVSPKSIYRLAHYYNISILQQLAINEIKLQLTPENIAFEVFGDLSKKYQEIREIYVDFTAKHWKVVKESKAYRQVKNSVKAGELEISEILLEVNETR